MTCVGSWLLPLGLSHPSKALGLNSVSMTTLPKGRDRPVVLQYQQHQNRSARGVAHANRIKPQSVSLTRSKGSAGPLMMLSDAVQCGATPPPGQSRMSSKVLWRSCGTLGRARSRQRPLRAPLRAPPSHSPQSHTRVTTTKSLCTACSRALLGPQAPSWCLRDLLPMQTRTDTRPERRPDRRKAGSST